MSPKDMSNCWNMLTTTFGPYITAKSLFWNLEMLAQAIVALGTRKSLLLGHLWPTSVIDPSMFKPRFYQYLITSVAKGWTTLPQITPLQSILLYDYKLLIITTKILYHL